MRLYSKIGIFGPDGEIILRPEISVSWKWLSNKNIPELSQGTPLDVEITLNEKVILSGDNGIIWGTFDERQAEVIQNALLVQNITSAIGKVDLKDQTLFLIKIYNQNDADDAMDFIWRKISGLRLEPDWSYAEGEPNKSFEKWINL